ncbi:MAG: YcaQ family DNA glycosylase [Chloroflexi bacterium]|nr:YcaQ family DNA glycosylase [Chloroflexota bacterium]
MLTKADLSIGEARRIALAAQGFVDPRPRGRVDIRHLRRVLDRIGLLQIDSVNVLVRSHYMPLFSRLGPYPHTLLDDAVYQRKELYETWAHEASLVPVQRYPLLRHIMNARMAWPRHRRWVEENQEYVDSVLVELERRGPLAASDLEEPGRRAGSWWQRSKGKTAMEWHFRRGAVMAQRRDNFERVYDLTERIMPRHNLEAEPPDEATSQRELLLLAARSHGVGTAGDLADYYRLPIVPCRAHLRDLADEGALREVAVEGWRERAYLHPQAQAPRSINARALLTPFDSLIWERKRTERVFGFRYRIEIYVPEKQRQYGYYVLPFLHGDRLVARVDLKSDRKAGRLQVKSAYAEEDTDEDETAGALAVELRSMAAWLELDGVSVGPRGNLATALRRAMRG